MSLRQTLKLSREEYEKEQKEQEKVDVYGNKDPSKYVPYPKSPAIVPKAKKRKTQNSEQNEDPEVKEFERLIQCHEVAKEIFFNPETGLLNLDSSDKSTQGLLKKKLDRNDFETIRSFYDNTIKTSIPQMLEWGESEKDPRRRGYFCLKRAGGTERFFKEGIQMNPVYFSGERADKINRKTYNKSFVDYVLDEGQNRNDKAFLGVLKKLIQFVHDKVERKYRGYVTLENLVAMQPNLHKEAEHLPLHYDTPRNDGFGVIIVTICMRGQGDIIIVDDGDRGEVISKKFKFNIKEGELYVLSGHARNKCLHGVLCRGYGHRESLNLRFGLHTKKFAFEEVDQHWPWE